QRGDAGDPEIRLLRSPQEKVAEPAARECADESRHQRDTAERHGGLAARHPANALEEGRHPEPEPAERKGVRAVPERGENEWSIAKEIAIRLGPMCGRAILTGGIVQSTRRILNQH